MMYVTLAAMIALGIPFRLLLRRLLQLEESVSEAVAVQTNFCTIFWAVATVGTALNGGAS